MAKSGNKNAFCVRTAVLAELRHHRHWQSALEHLSGCQFSMLPHMMPSQGMILGGTISLKGRNLTLASFHGINFRSRYWALFNIQHPYILFSTEAQKMEDEGKTQSCLGRDGAYAFREVYPLMTGPGKPETKCQFKDTELLILAGC